MLLGIGAYKDHEKYLARSLEVAATLETMVQEILTISRLETNVDFKMEHFDCAPMIHGYLREIDDLVATKRATNTSCYTVSRFYQWEQITD